MTREPGSFRDPHSRIFYAGGGVYRALSPQARDDFDALVSSGLLERLHADGRIVGTELIEDRSEWPTGTPGLPGGEVAGLLRHERIPFVSYPYEWPFEMLRDAARLQLDLLLDAVDYGLTLKDATPYNVQWRGAHPTFIDVASLERLGEGGPWIAYRQFCMQFLYPLMLRAYKDVPFQPRLRGAIDGISPAECARLLSWRDLLRRGVLKHVHLHARLERRYAADGGVRSELRHAGFGTELLRANLKAMSKLIERLSWRPGTTAWSGYATESGYPERDAALKRSFVADACRTRRWPLAWDLGCNEGSYARIAAEHSDYTVAMDADETVVNGLYLSLREEAADSILPLTVNIADPSPGLGWLGRERLALTDRGKPQLTLCLALVHHLSLTANVPLREIVDWLHDLGTSVVIEFVDREDEMAGLLISRKKPDSTAGYSRELFERYLSEVFEVERTEVLCEGRRRLYFAHPKSPPRAPV